MFKHISTYLSFSLLNSGTTLMTFAFLARSVEVDEFGTIGIFLSILYLLVPSAILNTIGLVGINYTKMNESDFQRFANNFFSMGILASLLILLSCLLAIFIFPEFAFSIFLMPFIVLVMILNAFDDSVSIQKNDSKRHGKFIFVSRMGIFVFTLVFIYIFKFSWSFYIFSILLAELISLKFRIKDGYPQIKNFRYELNRNYRVEFYSYGMPLFFLLASGWLLNNIDRFIVLEFFNLESVAMYVAAYQIGMAINLINQSITNGTVSSIYQSINLEKDTISLIHKYLKIFSICSLFLAAGVYFFFPIIIPILFGDQYSNSIDISILVALAFIFNGLYRIPSLVIDFYKRNLLKAWITFAAALINIIFSISFIEYYGILTPAYGTLCAYVFLALSVYLISKSLLKERP